MDSVFISILWLRIVQMTSGDSSSSPGCLQGGGGSGPPAARAGHPPPLQTRDAKPPPGAQGSLRPPWESAGPGCPAPAHGACTRRKAARRGRRATALSLNARARRADRMTRTCGRSGPFCWKDGPGPRPAPRSRSHRFAPETTLGPHRPPAAVSTPHRAPRGLTAPGGCSGEGVRGRRELRVQRSEPRETEDRGLGALVPPGDGRSGRSGSATTVTRLRHEVP